jgi:formylglycine-generating enzyme required for sulfatase activity
MVLNPLRHPLILTLVALVACWPAPGISGGDSTESLPNLELVFVKGGPFERGDTFGDGRANERPAHSVTVSDFYLGRHEVTVGQFRRFAEATAYRTRPEEVGWVIDVDAAMGALQKREQISWRNPGFSQDDDHPVVWVCWEDAAAFARWLSEQTGKRYRLPTEAEWEFAARSGGKREKWSGTSDRPGEYAWYAENSGARTHPTGQKAPNGLGIHDMSGNVWEWCQDWYADYEPRPEVLADPQGPATGRFKTLRGGSWRVDRNVVRVTYRNGYKLDYSHSSIGFRLALSAR